MPEVLEQEILPDGLDLIVEQACSEARTADEETKAAIHKAVSMAARLCLSRSSHAASPSSSQSTAPRTESAATPPQNTERAPSPTDRARAELREVRRKQRPSRPAAPGDEPTASHELTR